MYERDCRCPEIRTLPENLEMRVRQKVLSSCVLFCFFLGIAKVEAALVVGGVTELAVMTIQDLVLAPGTGLNPSDEEMVLADVSVPGLFIFDRLDQVGTTIVLENGTFSGSGFDTRLGGDLTLTGGNFTPMFGLLENVVQDPSHPGYDAGDPGSVSFALLSLTITDYAFRLDALGVELEILDPFLFRAEFDGLPPSPDVEYLSDPFSGLESRLDIYLAGTETIVGYSTNRRMFAVYAVPEPGSFTVFSILTGLFAIRRRTKR